MAIPGINTNLAANYQSNNILYVMKFYGIFMLILDINECQPNGGLGPCAQICTNTIGSFSCSCQPGYSLYGYACNGEFHNCFLLKIEQDISTLQTPTNAYQMEEEVHVTRYVPTPLDHSPAAVTLDTPNLDISAMVRKYNYLEEDYICYPYAHL